MSSAKPLTGVWLLPALAIVLFGLSGCQAVRNALGENTPPGVARASDTVLPLPSEPATLISPADNSVTTTPASTPPPMIVLTQPTPTSAPEVTLTTGISKLALLQIESPGPGSKIRDFVWVRANVYPGDNGNVSILLSGEDGRTIALREVNYTNWTTGYLSIAEQIQFTPIAASETALLSVFTKDGFGRIISLTSERILLLQVGPEEIEQPGFHGDPFVMSEPKPSTVAANGRLHIAGYAHVSEDTPVIAELIQTDGSVLASTRIQVTPLTTGEGYVEFNGALDYQVNQRTPVRFTLRQESSEMNSHTTVLNSYIIYLDP